MPICSCSWLCSGTTLSGSSSITATVTRSPPTIRPTTPSHTRTVVRASRSENALIAPWCRTGAGRGASILGSDSPSTGRATTTRDQAMTVAIRTEGLSKRYGDTVALDALELTVQAGEVYGYLGPHGAGKTTTIRLLLGLLRPSAGRAELFGLDAWRNPVEAHRRVAAAIMLALAGGAMIPRLTLLSR